MGDLLLDRCHQDNILQDSQERIYLSSPELILQEPIHLNNLAHILHSNLELILHSSIHQELIHHNSLGNIHLDSTLRSNTRHSNILPDSTHRNNILQDNILHNNIHQELIHLSKPAVKNAISAASQRKKEDVRSA